jgi:hypothetical protein
MGIWFPLGIALFHASNLRFLHVAKLQKKFARPELQRGKSEDVAPSLGPGRFRNMECTSKVMALIIAGMIVQVRLPIILR